MRAYAWIGAACAAAALGAGYFYMKSSPQTRLRENWVMLERFCVDCHNDAELTGGISFEGMHPRQS